MVINVICDFAQNSSGGLKTFLQTHNKKVLFPSIYPQNWAQALSLSLDALPRRATSTSASQLANEPIPECTT